MNRQFFFSKAFFPVFGVQFLGAFNDNVFKSALVMLITFKLAETPQQAALLTTVAAGIFILPFFLFSAYAGNLADAFEKRFLMRWIKLAEIGIMLVGGLALWMHSVAGLMLLLFLMGTQSAFFGPIKYAILPELVEKDHLTLANGWFSASTFIAILIGTIFGGWLVLVEQGELWLGIAVVLMALLGYFASLMVPQAHVREPIALPKFKPFKLLAKELLASRQYHKAFLAVMAISWFWFLGAAYLSQIPVMVKEYLAGDESVVLLFLTSFSIGIGVGAYLANRVLDLQVLLRLQWHGLLLFFMSVFILLSSWWTGEIQTYHELRGIAAFLTDMPSLGVLLCLFAVATLGGVYIVPLYTHLQLNSPEYFRGRMIAVNNIVNAFMMVISSIAFIIGYSVGLDLVDLFMIFAALNVFAALWIRSRIRLLQEQT